MTTVGVLALQGDVREHTRVLESLGVRTLAVKKPEQLALVDALVIPGGESTTIGKMAVRFGLFDPIRDALGSGLAALGTCAGLIFMSSAVTEGDQPLLGRLDVMVRRNAFGRQNDSFESPIDIQGFDTSFDGIFIRAPWVEKVGAEVEVLAAIDEYPVMVRQGHLLATSFHPELTGDERIHQMLLDLI